VRVFIARVRALIEHEGALRRACRLTVTNRDASCTCNRPLPATVPHITSPS